MKIINLLKNVNEQFDSSSQFSQNSLQDFIGQLVTTMPSWAVWLICVVVGVILLIFLVPNLLFVILALKNQLGFQQIWVLRIVALNSAMVSVAIVLLIAKAPWLMYGVIFAIIAQAHLAICRLSSNQKANKPRVPGTLKDMVPWKSKRNKDPNTNESHKLSRQHFEDGGESERDLNS